MSQNIYYAYTEITARVYFFEMYTWEPMTIDKRGPLLRGWPWNFGSHFAKLNLNSTQFNSNWGWDGLYFRLIQPPTTHLTTQKS